ncbi:hypothetical protein BaRGS_00002318 [Batillaria attramentaria]|uniref:Uncharacterized protein n=1 Tax=Batillaria attramentaria TaxID=370345 RepID=A0ABD0M4E1_9CAEN
MPKDEVLRTDRRRRRLRDEARCEFLRDHWLDANKKLIKTAFAVSHAADPVSALCLCVAADQSVNGFNMFTLYRARGHHHRRPQKPEPAALC